MNLRVKVFLSVGVVFGVLFVVTYGILSYVLRNDYRDLERHSVEENVDRVLGAFQNEIDSLSVKISDWGQWDDTYAFVQDRNEEYIGVNLQNISLELLHIQFIVITDKDGNILFRKQIDASGNDVPFSPSFEEHIRTHAALMEHADPQSVHSGIIRLPEGVVMSVARAVTSSDGLSPVAGTILFAAFVDDAVAEKISALTHLKVVFRPYRDSFDDSDFSLAARMIEDDHTIFLQPRSDRDTTISGYAVRNDIDGERALITQVTFDRTLYQRGQQSIILFTWIILVVGSIITITAWYLFELLVLRRLFRLGTAVEEVTRRQDNESQIFLPGKDEFSHLAGRINGMLVSLRDIKLSKEDSEKTLNELVENRTRELREKIVEAEQSKLAILNILEDVGASEKQLQQKTEDLTKFQQAVDASFDHTIITDSDGVILHANHAAEVLTGYGKEEMIGRRPSLWGSQMSADFYETLWNTIKHEKQGYAGELTNRRKDGELYLASIRISPIFDAAGELKFFVGIERDITEERAVQRRIIRHADELEAANNRIEEQKDRAESILRFLRSIGEGVFATDISGNIIFINEAAQQMVMKPLLSAEGKNVSEVFSFIQETTHQPMTALLIVQQALKNKRMISFPQNTFSIQHDGRKIPVAGTCSLIRGVKDDVIGTIVVFRDVTQLRELDQMKNNFLSTAAHQLRTPLGSMRWSMELLINGDFGKLPKAAKEVVQQIYDNNVRMVLLVNDLLDVSRIDSDKGREEKSLVDIAAMLRDIVQTMRPEAERRSVKITLALPKKPIPQLFMPAKHLYEAIENLISNGIKYNKDDGTLTVSVRVDAKTLFLTIADTGIGIPQADESKVFSKFFRSANAVLKETEGSGLGLSVVKSYLEESGAKISFESKENVGTTFSVEFPLESGGK